MTDTVTEFVAADDQAEPSPEAATVEQKLIDQLVEQARSKGLQLTGEGGLLQQQLTKTVLTDIGPVEIDVPRDQEGSPSSRPSSRSGSAG